MKKAGIGIIGCGTVGTGVAKILKGRSDSLRDKVGVELRLAAVCDRDQGRLSDPALEGIPSVEDANSVIENPAVDIVIELIGGTDSALDITLCALKAGKPVVTANKALIATRGSEIFTAARAANTCVAFEASVCGAVPVLAAIRDGLAANNVTAVRGIVNGTSNYILTRMANADASYDEALDGAKRHGFAESDPTLDVEGIDSAHKIAILSRLAFGVDFDFDSIYTEGITRITPQDIKYAREFGYAVKLLAIGRNDGSLDIRVHPVLLPKKHPLAFVDGVLNAVCLSGSDAGDISLQGAGAGQMPTAGAVVADIIDVALGRTAATFESLKIFSENVPQKELVGIENIETRYYTRFSVVDKPGVLSGISGIFGEHNISIASVLQMERDAGKEVPVVMMLHSARERDMRKAVEAINKIEAVGEPGLYMRVEQ